MRQQILNTAADPCLPAPAASSTVLPAAGPKCSLALRLQLPELVTGFSGGQLIRGPLPSPTGAEGTAIRGSMVLF